MTNIYPNSVPEFRIFKKINGEQELQVRYINQPQGYVGKWMPVNVVEETNAEVK